ncbi:Guanine nucleotide exchange factor SRM1 [Rhodotorula toruloides]|uniref:BY PROTMAP: gi/472585495/gb/EMS23049.1/ regulator of chromosome condensation [Rhodosporidium toruloides NP11] gi/647399391/emb/CDR44129.1/ RHTO0S09e00232g1_1 [Rhodosporidium toruloides] n=1 Tax=Rhodotorula toruloides TaxID=5286 RepID=A0A0K3CM03_RHOTO|nr:Guanine nucleotide exchange factor SRM1 [Rhodotorula toruloides]PRQ71951.1 Regulator of chromosome condensation 1/beta-lactamase-inhibitor protein II [Rhodotorula toruloides]
MPPRRARASSVSSTTSASNPLRRSSRASNPPPPLSAPKNPSTPSKKRKVVASSGRGRRASSVMEESEEESEDEEESSEDEGTARGRKRKAPSKSTPRKKVVGGAKAPRAVKAAPKPKAIIPGLNALPTRFLPFPTHSSFPSLTDLDALPTPSDAPRAIFVFGTGDMGQNGLGVDDPKALDEITRPRRHVGFVTKFEEGEEGWEGGVADLVCGGMHTLAVDGEGRVWSWGINDNAALGRLTTKPGFTSEELEATPGLVENLPLESFKAVRVAAGDSVSLAISERGEVRAWGSFRAAEGLLGFDGSAGSSKTQLVPTALRNLDKHTIVQIATGDDHFLALTSTGMVFACGNGEQHQLGRKIIQRHKEHGLTPERLALKNIVLVGSGSYHSFAVDQKGEVYAWGLNSYHQTGVSDEDGGYADVIQTPTLVASLSPSKHDGARVVQIAGGVHHSLFLFSNGEVWACGRSDGHEVGLPDDHAEMVASNERKQEAKRARAEREQQELASMRGEDGAVTRTNEDGSTMTSEEAALAAAEAAARGVPLPNDYIPLPTRLSFPKEPKEWQRDVKRADDLDDFCTEETHIVQIAAGTRHNFAVSARGYAYSWGVGASAQLGQGPEEEVEEPTRIFNTALSGVRVLRAETGGQHSVIVGIDRDYEDKKAEREKKRKEKEEAEAAAKKEAEPVVNGTGEAEQDGDAKMADGEEEKKEGDAAHLVEEAKEPVVVV